MSNPGEINAKKVKAVQAMMLDDPLATKLLMTSIKQPYADAKALANFLFREVIEEAHEKYNISQEDIKAMCKTAVNRAQLYLTFTKHGRNKAAREAFRFQAYDCAKWDNPEITEELRTLEADLRRLETLIRTLDEAVTGDDSADSSEE